jgi:hypothetical protein
MMIDMIDPVRCVLGLLYGFYPNGLEALGLYPDEAYQYGFDVGGPRWAGAVNRAAAWEHLNQAWKHAIDHPH